MSKVAFPIILSALAIFMKISAAAPMSSLIFVGEERVLSDADRKRLGDVVASTRSSCASDQQARFVLTEEIASDSGNQATRRTAVIAASLAEFGIKPDQIVQKSVSTVDSSPSSTFIGGAVTVLALCVKT